MCKTSNYSVELDFSVSVRQHTDLKLSEAALGEIQRSHVLSVSINIFKLYINIEWFKS